MARHPRWARRLLGEDDFDAIARAIADAERRTSGEIRVHLDRHVPTGPGGRPRETLDRAREVFLRLGMHRAADRHGVLIYLSVEDRRLAIVGDEGIHGRVGDEHWRAVRDLMVERLRASAPREALLAAIAAIGSELAAHFPRRPGETGTSPDEVSLG